MIPLQEKLAALAKEIPPACKIIVVTKTQPLESIRAVYDAGHREFGENKVQELISRYESLPRDINWHLIGHLQSNKVRYIAPFIGLIHSVDSLKLLQEINKQALKIPRIIPCLLQVHIAGEDTKFGFSEQEILDMLKTSSLNDLKHVTISGLMGMATFTDNKDQVGREFRGLRSLFEKLKAMELPACVKMEELSMGMSGDFNIALKEGSTMIRVGTAIFGERNYA